ncbi:MAG: hypothetical protein H7A08_05130 [Oceanospirillaceae bacterium]|nr:hypothetical protein [Oceanospirillaceae bacterium]MCP5350104.1 hypothetical protein [Oceanospirillaceae bacterium]
MLLLAYADSSIEMGEGHCMRLHNLLQEFPGWKCIWLFQSLTGRTKAALQDFYEFFELQDFKCYIAENPLNVDLVIIDSYGISPEVLRPIIGERACYVFLDDLANRPLNVDILVDGSPVRRYEDYEDLLPDSCMGLIGAEYLILNRTYRKKITIGRCVCHLYFGATDAKAMTLPYLIRLLSVLPDFSFHVVVTRQTPHLDEIKYLSKKFKNRVVVFYEPDTLLTSFDGCELAIGAPGVATWERMAAGLTSFLLSTQPNQIPILQELHAHKYIFYLGDGQETESCIRNFMENMHQFKPACLPVDGYGAERVAGAIKEVLAHA